MEEHQQTKNILSRINLSSKGIYLIDKPKGCTSYQVVRQFQQQFPKGTRVGHSGTLDPIATGLLILLTGSSTKLQKSFQEMPKTYTGKLLLGLQTDTGDLQGNIISKSKVENISALQLQDKLNKFIKELEVFPPDYSAIKYKGKPLYYYARKGIHVEKKLKKMTLYRWDLTELTLPTFSFDLDCSSGTYVRTLAELLGKELGCGAAVAELRRTRIGPYDIKDAISLGLEVVDSKLAPLNQPLTPSTLHSPLTELGDDGSLREASRVPGTSRGSRGTQRAGP